MHRYSKRLISILNRAGSPKDLVEVFPRSLDYSTAEALLAARHSLPRNAFASVSEIMSIEEIGRLIDVLIEDVRHVPWSDSPALLLPVRLETRFKGQELLVRIYPDQIHIDEHERRLTRVEFKDGCDFYYFRRMKQERAAWRHLATQYGPERAAWIIRVVGDHECDVDGYDPIPSDKEALLTAPRLQALPERFVLYLYGRDEKVRSIPAKNPVANPLTPVRFPSDSNDSPSDGNNNEDNAAGLFTNSAAWVTNFSKAEEKGMAFRVGLTAREQKEGFERVVVVGLSHGGPNKGSEIVENLFESHHYSDGAAFVAWGTSTNNTETTQSGHSESTENRESSYSLELSGPGAWSEVKVPRTNAQRLGYALGLGTAPEVFRHLAHANDDEDALAEEMQTALWPATGDYLLRYMLPDVLDSQNLKRLGNHFTRFVRATGPLPTLRIGDQPYGILPATRIHDGAEPRRSSEAEDNEVSFEAGLHSTLLGLYPQWLSWARDSKRVPRIPDDDSPDTDGDLLAILAMEPVSNSCRARPFVDERLVSWLLIAMRSHFFGPATPYSQLSDNPLEWVQRWSEVWTELREEQAEQWSEWTGVDTDVLATSPLFRLVGWWNDLDLEQDLEIKLTQQESADTPHSYLQQLCRREEPESNEEQAANDPPSETLLYDLLERSLRLAGNSSIDHGTVKTAICRLCTSSHLAFFNTVTSADQIVERIKDDPAYGSGSPLAYGVRRSLAERILEERDQLPGGRFENVEQIDAIYGVGDDTRHDILHTFNDSAERPDIDRLFRQTLDLCTNRLDAWITSLATKRLNTLREANPRGLYVGAYGYVENLHPEGDQESAGFIHTPSQGQADAAAVLHNANLTYQNGTDVNPFRVHLDSRRVRDASRVLQGIREGQALAALLGYQFERDLHDQQLDQYIDTFRNAFPLEPSKETTSVSGGNAAAVTARNVVDGLAMVRWWQPMASENTEAEQELANLIDAQTGGDDSAGLQQIQSSIEKVTATLDGIYDMLFYESAYHAVQGNYERAGAAIEATAGQLSPPAEIESLETPFNGNTYSQRVCLLFAEGDTGANSESGNASPRSLIEPRIAAWAADLFGPLSEIGCAFRFKTPRININSASEAQIADLPVLGIQRAGQIVEYRKNHGRFSSIDDLAEVDTIDLSQADVNELRPWLMTGSEENGEDRHYERINVNTAPPQELEQLPGITANLASEVDDYRNQTADSRPFRVLDDLKTNVDGIGEERVEDLRRFATTGINHISLAELGLDPVDLLYLSASPLEGGETELEQRIHYWIRREFALPVDVHVELVTNKAGVEPYHYKYSLEEAVTLGAEAIRMLGQGSVLRPDTLGLTTGTLGTDFTESNISELDDRITAVLTDLNRILGQLGADLVPPLGGENPLVPDSDNLSESPSLTELLFAAGRYSATRAIPKTPGDDLQARKATVVKDLFRRGKACQVERKKSKQESLRPGQCINHLIKAANALVGNDVVVLPTVDAHTDESAVDSETIFDRPGLFQRGSGEEQLHLWWQQVSLIHEPVGAADDFMMLADAWRQGGGIQEPTEASALTLHVAQLPADSGMWLGLEGAEVYGRNVVSIVAATNSQSIDSTQPIAGLLLDQWEERIPNEAIETSVAFQYDGPSTQAPQAMLLAVPGPRDVEAKAWSTDDLAEIVVDTMDLAKTRLVDTHAMGRRDDDSLDEPGVGSVLPGLMLPMDRNQSGIVDRHAAFDFQDISHDVREMFRRIFG